MKAGPYRDDGFEPGQVVTVKGRGKQRFTLKDRYQYRTTDGWYARDEEERHHVFPTSLMVAT